MTGLCGVFGARPDGEPAEILRRMLAGDGQAAHASTRQLDGAAIGTLSGATASALIANDRLLLALVGHPRLRTARGWSTDPGQIAAAVADRWSAALTDIGGDFALAAWDAQRSCGLIAVDRLAARSLVYGHQDEALVFASTLDLLGRHPGVRRELSPQAVFDYLHFHVCPGPQTIYHGLLRLPAGHYLEVDRARQWHLRQYWSIDFREDRSPDFDTLRTAFVSTLRESVARASSGAACGAFLSGGTDSSTVSGMLGRVRGERARTFSIGFDAAGYDEMSYARIAARHFDCEHHERYVTPADVVAAVPKIAACYDQPFGNASAVPAYYCAALARERGVERLLAGDGGDELFGGNERYARQYLLSLYHRLPAPLRASLIEPLARSAPVRGAVGLRKLHRYVQQAQASMPARYESHNLLSHLGPQRVLEPDFLTAVDLDHPHELMREAHAPYADSSLINQMLGIDLRFTLTDNDLPKVTTMCELAGVDVAFPLLDDDLVEFSARLPASMKLRGTRLRWFFKEALRDFLPAEIIRKRKHGFGLPVGAWLLADRRLLSLASDAIDALRPHGIVRPAFVDDLRGRLLAEHPAYYGTMMWLLMILGLWLDARRR